jgi:hypothetical protein
MALKKNGTRQFISTRALNQLRQLPEIGALNQTAQLDDMGRQRAPRVIRDSPRATAVSNAPAVIVRAVGQHREEFWV